MARPCDILVQYIWPESRDLRDVAPIGPEQDAPFQTSGVAPLPSTSILFSAL